MNAFTFRVPSISREGFFHFFRVKSLPLMQHLFEEQTTLFHLAEHLSPLSLTVNVRNMGKKPPRGTPGFLTLQSIGETGEQARSHPMFKAAGSTPVCIITAAALRESLQQNLEVVTRKEKKAWNYRKTLRKLPVGRRVLPESILWCPYKKTHDVFTDAQVWQQPASAPTLPKSTPVSEGTGPEQTAGKTASTRQPAAFSSSCLLKGCRISSLPYVRRGKSNCVVIDCQF